MTGHRPRNSAPQWQRCRLRLLRAGYRCGPPRLRLQRCHAPLRPGLPRLTWKQEEPEPQVAAAEAGLEPVAVGRPADPDGEAPAPAADDAARASGLIDPSVAVMRCSLVVIKPVVLDSLKHITVHIVETECVGFLFAPGWSLSSELPLYHPNLSRFASVSPL
jgi:hypothetical protein